MSGLFIGLIAWLVRTWCYKLHNNHHSRPQRPDMTPCSVAPRRREEERGADSRWNVISSIYSGAGHPGPRVSTDQFVTHRQHNHCTVNSNIAAMMDNTVTTNSDQQLICKNQWIISRQFQRFVFVILSGCLGMALSYNTGGYLPPVSSGHVSPGYPGHVSSLSPEYSSPPCSEYFHAQFPTCTLRYKWHSIHPLFI